MARWSVYADLLRLLSEDERGRIFAAVEALIPDSGCVGPHHGRPDEVYFNVEAATAAQATSAARRYLDAVLGRAAVAADYEITVHPDRR